MVRSLPVDTIQGGLAFPKGARFAIVASRFNELVVDRLVDGAVDALVRHGAPADAITVVRVPGAWELPAACKALVDSGKFSALVALGAVIRGATSHFDFVAGQAASGLARLSIGSGPPIGFGLLTTETSEQALERAGGKAGNKGADAALVALEMLNLQALLKGAGT